MMNDHCKAATKEHFGLKPLDFVTELKNIGALDQGYSDLITCYCRPLGGSGPKDPCRACPDTLKYGHLANVVYVSYGKSIIHYERLCTRQIIFKLNKPNNQELEADYPKLLEKPFRLIIDCSLKRFKGNAFMSSHVIPISNKEAFFDYIVKHNAMEMKSSKQYLAHDEPEEIIPDD